MAATFHEELDAHGVLAIRFNRPERYNALTFEVYRELADRFAALADEPDVHAVVISGEGGKAFCSGGDVHDIIGQLFERDEAAVLEFTRMTGELIANMRKLHKPIVAAIDGIAAGAGSVIALASDFRILSERGRLAFLFIKVGLTGADMGAGYLLPRLVGLARATELLMLGDTIDAETAERYGLANRVVAPEACLSTAMELATRLAEGPLDALASTKRCLEAEWTMTLDEAIELEAVVQARHLREPDHRAFYDAFLAKQPPRFSGARAQDPS